MLLQRALEITSRFREQLMLLQRALEITSRFWEQLMLLQRAFEIEEEDENEEASSLQLIVRSFVCSVARSFVMSPE